MNQEITLSIGVIQYLYSLAKDPLRNDVRSIIDLIEQNRVVSDYNKHHFQNILNAIDELPGEPLTESLRNIVTGWINNKNRFVKTNESSINDEFCLAACTSDKILFSPNFTKKEIRKNKTDIEFHDSDSFISPEAAHRLKHCPSVIVLNHGAYYEISQILGPFLRNAQYIKVKDPYLPNETATLNLEKLLCCVKGNIKIELICLKKVDYIHDADSGKNYYKFSELVSSARRRGLNVSLSDYKIPKRKHIERYIYTDKFTIYIPGGLDFIDETGFYKSNDTDDEKEKAAIRISFK